MNLRDKISDIRSRAERENWRFSHYFNAFKDAGVDFFIVDLLDVKITYFGMGQCFTVDLPIGDEPLEYSSVFDTVKISGALLAHRQGLTDFLQFIHEIANAGVKAYRVDLETGRVIYQGSIGQEFSCGNNLIS